MRKIISILLAAIIIASAPFLFAACSGQSTLPNGTYKFESSSGNPFNPGEFMSLGTSFSVSGNSISASLTEDIVFSYEYTINNKKITLTDENGDEIVLSFEKKNNNSYLIGETTYTGE